MPHCASVHDDDMVVDSIQLAHKYYQDGATVVFARDFKRQRYIKRRTSVPC